MSALFEMPVLVDVPSVALGFPLLVDAPVPKDSAPIETGEELGGADAPQVGKHLGDSGPPPEEPHELGLANAVRGDDPIGRPARPVGGPCRRVARFGAQTRQPLPQQHVGFGDLLGADDVGNDHIPVGFQVRHRGGPGQWTPRKARWVGVEGGDGRGGGF